MSGKTLNCSSVGVEGNLIKVCQTINGKVQWWIKTSKPRRRCESLSLILCNKKLLQLDFTEFQGGGDLTDIALEEFPILTEWALSKTQLVGVNTVDEHTDSNERARSWRIGCLRGGSAGILINIHSEMIWTLLEMVRGFVASSRMVWSIDKHW